MGCKYLINRSDVEPADEGEILAAYYQMAEHRMSCEVCKDEDLAHGILQKQRWH